MKTFNTKDSFTVGSRVRVIRGDLKQQEFAEILGVSSVTISNYETGRRLPKREVLEKIARHGKASIDWILTGRDPLTTTLEELSAEDLALLFVFHSANPEEKIKFLRLCKEFFSNIDFSQVTEVLDSLGSPKISETLRKLENKDEDEV